MIRKALRISVAIFGWGIMAFGLLASIAHSEEMGLGARIITGAILLLFGLALVLICRRDKKRQRDDEDGRTYSSKKSISGGIMKMRYSSWMGIGMALSIVIIAIAIAVEVVPQIGSLFGAPVKFFDKVAEVVKSWGQNKIQVNIQNDRLEVKPIAEFAFSRTRVRSIISYQTTVLSSTKRIIAHQAFDIRIGWDLRDDVVVRLSPKENIIYISASTPRILSTTHVEATPIYLFREDGVLNKLTPEDANELQKQLEESAKNSPDLLDGIKVAKESFENFFRGIFQVQGLNVIFQYRNQESNRES